MRPCQPLSALVVLLLGLAGCGASPSLQAARAGDANALRAAMASDHQRGALDDDEARELAEALASGIVERAKGLEGAKRLRAIATCARPLRHALKTRAAKEDEVGAIAALVRIDAELIDVDAYVERAAQAGGNPYRAVGARGLVTPEDSELRRALIVDHDQAVRREALRAAFDAGDAADSAMVLEAARLDPSPAARLAAIGAAGAIGTSAVVLALRDQWATAGEAERQAIAQAWAAPRALDAGGREQLRWGAGQAGMPALFAAILLAGTDDVSPAVRAEAEGVLLRTIQGGVTRERVFAVAHAPLDSSVRAALVKAEQDADEVVVAAALARRLSDDALTPSARRATVTRLLSLAGGATAPALLAKGALARAGAPEAIALLERELRAGEPRVRSAAGASLAVLGELRRAAPLLADPDANVRLTVACAILRAP
jgi:hypothetical protein